MKLLSDEWGCRVRVANELGAGNGKAAKFASIVSVVTSVIISVFFWLLILIFRGQFGYLFSASEAVIEEVNKLSPLLGFTVLLNSVQPVLSGGCYNNLNFYHLLSYLILFLPIYWMLNWNILHPSSSYDISIGVAIGSGWQKYVAFIDLGCYYLIGLPLGYLMGFVFHLGVQVRCVHFPFSSPGLGWQTETKPQKNQ